jgi:hypothetical protein
MEGIFLSKSKIDEFWIEQILRSLEGLEYGSVQIVVHDSQIMQIERLEKFRFPGDKTGAVKKRHVQQGVK